MAWLRHTVTVPPSEEPITLSDVKVHCRMSGTSDDVALTAYIRAARSLIENSCGVKLITQSCSLLSSSWQDLKRFQVGPLQSITSIKYLDQAGVEQTLNPSIYSVIGGRNPSIQLTAGSAWPPLFYNMSNVYDPRNQFNFVSNVPDAVRITGVFGFGNSDSVPDDIKLAMYLLVGGWNENRESIGSIRSNTVAELPLGVAALLADYSTIC